MMAQHRFELPEGQLPISDREVESHRGVLILRNKIHVDAAPAEFRPRNALSEAGIGIRVSEELLDTGLLPEREDILQRNILLVTYDSCIRAFDSNFLAEVPPLESFEPSWWLVVHLLKSQSPKVTGHLGTRRTVFYKEGVPMHILPQHNEWLIEPARKNKTHYSKNTRVFGIEVPSHH